MQTYYRSVTRGMVALFVCLIAAVITGQALAQTTIEQVDGFTHSVWTTRDGIPGDLGAMAQTPDGWIWLAAGNHLYRFDGVTAELVDVPSGDATRLITILATKSGDLWLGYLSGLVLTFPAGDYHHPRMMSGKIPPLGGRFRFLQDNQGGVWLSIGPEIYKAEKGEWRRIGEGAGLYSEIYDVGFDTEGMLWILSNAGVFTLAPGHAQFEQKRDLPTWLGQMVLGQRDAPKLESMGTFGATYLHIIMAASGKKAAPTFAASRYGSITDAKGGFWLVSQTDGLRWSAASDARTLDKLGVSLSTTTAVDPANWIRLSSNGISAAMEDRQHNIWVTSTVGLERFRPSIATTLKLPSGISEYTMLPDHDGSIWFGAALSAHGYRWWHVASDITPMDGYDLDTTAAYRDTDGSVLLGTGGGFLRRFADGKFEAVEPLPPDAKKGDDIMAIARDGQQKLWLGFKRSVIYQLNNGRWTAKGGFDELPEKGVLRAVTDAQGRLWLSYPDELFVIDGQHLTRYASGAGMDITFVGDIVTEGIPLVGGADGLAAFDGRRFHRISALDPSALTGINGIVRLKDGAVWLNGLQGGVRIGAGEIERALKDDGYKIALRVFGVDDGMPGIAHNGYPRPSLIEGTNGRLWFSDTQGIAWIDPAKVPPSRDEPMVVIRSITAGKASYRPDALPALPPGTHSIQIDYTVIGLSNPANARFRYQMTGLDQDWQDGGARRQAFYTNLGPGTYQFRVTATNDDNAWTPDAALITVTIEPMFYQTIGFMALCILLILALLWMAHLYRLRLLTLRFRQRLEERHAERDRIARELHDTYIQTVQGLVLQVDAVSHELPEGSTKSKILSALNVANDALVEGRNRVYALRADASNSMDLGVAFEEVLQEHRGDQSPVFKVTLTGAVKSADPLVIDELYVSGREAIINAFHHASAKEIHVGIHYDQTGIRVEVTDDGKGIDPQVIQVGGIPGHWGLRGMRERMERIGGECHITSDGANGTKVMLFVAARRAYSHH
jgi:signal transduction histidine kinase/ligand-binding sensor domain-containing protein